MKLTMKLLMIVGFGFSASLAAANVPGWSGDLTIDNLRPWSSGFIYGEITSGTPLCGSSVIVIKGTDDTRTRDGNGLIFSTLLSSVALGATVKVYVSECNSAQHAVISSAWLNKP